MEENETTTLAPLLFTLSTTMPEINSSAIVGGENKSLGCVQPYEYFNPGDRWLLGAVAIPFILAGLITNIISICVFAPKEMRKALVNTYLLALGISDSILLVCAFISLCLARNAEITELWSLAYFSIKVAPVVNVFQNAAYFTSVWITVGMYFHRFIGIWFPLSSNQYLRSAHVWCYLYLIAAINLAYTVPKYFETKQELCFMEPINVTLPWMSHTEFGKNIPYRKIRSMINIMVFYAIPFITLIIVNSFVIVALRRSKQLRSVMLASESAAARQRVDQEIKITTMLIIIVMAFLFSNTMIFIYNLLLQFRMFDAMDRISAIANFSAMLNPLLNSIIYWVFVPRYREAFQKFICCGATKRVDRSTSPSTDTRTTGAGSSSGNPTGVTRYGKSYTRNTLATLPSSTAPGMGSKKSAASVGCQQCPSSPITIAAPMVAPKVSITTPLGMIPELSSSADSNTDKFCYHPAGRNVVELEKKNIDSTEF